MHGIEHLRRAASAAALLALLAAAPAHAGSTDRTGTSGAVELLIPVGARGTALGGAVQSDVDGIEAMFWNPAGLASVERTQALFTHTSYFADMKMNYAGIGTRVGNFGTLGVAAKVLSIGDIPVTTEAAPEGTGEILHPTFAVLGATWAHQFTDRVNFGFTTNWINENIANNTAGGLAFDFGVQYATGWRGLRFGIAMKNIGAPMKYTGPGFEILTRDPSADPNAGTRGLSFSSQPFDLPSNFAFSSSVDLLRDPHQALLGFGAFQNNNFSGDNVRTGLEWTWHERVALRGSYFGTFAGTTDFASGETTQKFRSGDDLYSGLALGAGTYTKFGENGRAGIDLTWRPARAPFDDIVEVGLKLDF
jgi:hypothetical protein